MSKVCEVCGRGTITGNNVSHSKVKTRRTQKVNLQNKEIDGKRTKVCTSCLKTYKKKQSK